MTALGSALRPLCVAIVGSGPSGFYAAQALMAGDIEVRVDLYERLPTPYGLVRAGVAPDHPGIKATAKVYQRLAADPRLRLRGNVRVGQDVSVDELQAAYDAVVYAVGCEAGRALELPGADLVGVHTATDFVYWYNGHPDHTGHRFPLESTARAVVVGNGNVAMDVTRVLVRDRGELAETDIARHALDALAASPLSEVTVMGRRGPAQAAYSPKELRDITQLADVSAWVLDEDATLSDATRAWLDGRELDRATRKKLDLVAGMPRERGDSGRGVQLRYRTSPVAFEGHEGRLTGVRCVRTELVRSGDRLSARPTGETWVEPCGLALLAIGYRGVPIPGLPHESGSGVVSNRAGRVEGMPQTYVVGWAKRGPTGLIGTNRGDSRATVAALFEDVAAFAPAAGRPEDIDRSLGDRGVRVVSFDDWLRLDAEELRRGQEAGCARLKFTRVDEMLAWLG